MSLSIIIPVHNTEQYLTECLDSVLLEINIDDEIILVENGSSDHSWELCQKYAKKNPAIKAVQMDTAGVSKARNYGICLAKGDWITFLDSDDHIDPSIIHTAHKLKNHLDIEVVLFRYCYLHLAHNNEMSASEELQHVDSDLLRRSVLEFGKYEKQIIELSSLDNMSIWTCWGKLYRKSLIKDKKIRFPEKLYLSEDTAFVFQVYSNTDRIYASQMTTYYYRATPNSVSRNVTIKMINNNRYLRKWMMHYVASHGLEKTLEEEVSTFLVRKFIEECLYLRFCDEKSRTTKLRYTKKNAEEPYMKKALHKVDYRWLVPGKKNTLIYGTVLWNLKRNYYRLLYIK
jgi:glycosyltransferase involved in cell wall biosynthesis